MRIWRFEFDDWEIRRFKRFMVGASPFLIIWVAFGLGYLFGIFDDFYWWTLPYIATSIALFIMSINKCSDEFKWNNY